MNLEAWLNLLPTLGTVAGSALGVIASSRVWQYRIAEPRIAQIDPKDDHTIHPQPFFSG